MSDYALDQLLLIKHNNIPFEEIEIVPWGAGYMMYMYLVFV